MVETNVLVAAKSATTTAYVLQSKLQVVCVYEERWKGSLEVLPRGSQGNGRAMGQLDYLNRLVA